MRACLRLCGLPLSTINDVSFNDAALFLAASRGQRGEKKTLLLHLSGDSSRWWSPNTALPAPPAASNELRGGSGPDAQRHGSWLQVEVLKGPSPGGGVSNMCTQHQSAAGPLSAPTQEAP